MALLVCILVNHFNLGGVFGARGGFCLGGLHTAVLALSVSSRALHALFSGGLDTIVNGVLFGFAVTGPSLVTG